MHGDQRFGEWRMWMIAAELSPRTIDDRISVLVLLVRADIDPVTATWQELSRFLATAPWAPASRRTRYAQLRAFYKWLVLTDQRGDDPTMKLARPRAPRGVPHPVRPESLDAILAKANRRRTRAMVLLALYQGLRVHEIAKVRGQDVRGQSLSVTGKGGVTALLPMHALVAAEAAGMPETGWWFPNYRDGGPITSGNVSKVLGTLLKRAGVHGSAHSMRHFFGTEALRAAGGNLRVAQELLRHASPATTAIYTKVDDVELRAAVNGLPLPRTA
jgi:site-specific recombinase XerD